MVTVNGFVLAMVTVKEFVLTMASNGYSKGICINNGIIIS